MSSLKAVQIRKADARTHSLIYEIKEVCWWLKNNGYKIHMMWIPSHVGVMCNHGADQAGDAVENDIEWYVTDRLSDFLLLSRVRLLGGRQSNCHGSDMGRYALVFALV
jgi:hypothetical protein